MSNEQTSIKEPIRVQVGYGHCFADDYLTTLHFLLKQAKENNDDIGVFTYTLPIILISIAFLESNINNVITLFDKPNNLIDYKSPNRELTKQICDDFVQIDKTPFIEKYSIILKYYKNINMSEHKINGYYSKVIIINKLRNLLVHDKSYAIPFDEKKNKIVTLLENQKWLKPNYNLSGIVPNWLPYLEYENICLMVKVIFEFYINFSKLLIPDKEPTYQNKIESIISWHPLLKNLEGISNAK